MAKDGEYLSVFIPRETLDRLEKFWHREELRSRVAALRVLLDYALQSDSKKPIKVERP